MTSIIAAVIGLGVGEQHARALAKTEKAQLKWVIDYDLTKAKNLAQELNVSHYSDTYQDALDDAETNFVSLATYDHEHTQQVLAAFETGKHVFVEKPLCYSEDELNDLQKAFKKHPEFFLASNLVLRKAKLFEWLKNEIASGVLGEIYAFDGEYLYGRKKKLTHGWRKDIDDYSVIFGGGIHLIDLMLVITGQQPSYVHSLGNQIATKGTDFRYADFVTSTYQFKSGMIGRITANFGCVHPHQHIIRIYGTKGTFILDDKGPRIQTSFDPHNDDIYLANRSRSHEAEAIKLNNLPEHKGDFLIDFITAIQRGSGSAWAEHEINLMKACLAAEKSARTGKIIEV